MKQSLEKESKADLGSSEIGTELTESWDFDFIRSALLGLQDMADLNKRQHQILQMSATAIHIWVSLLGY